MRISCPECKHIQSDEWQFCHTCGYNIFFKTVTITSKPSWVAESERILNSRRTDDPELESKATEAYETMRSKEIRSSRAARAWEEGRKAELARYKPEWVKKGRNTKELPVITKV